MVAKNRVLLVLAVLSGEKPVSTAIEQFPLGFLARLLLSARDQGAQRDAFGLGTRLGWRTRVRTPTDGAAPPDQGADRQGGGRAEQAQRRAERLLYMQRKLTSSGPVKTHRGRPPTKTTRSTPTASQKLALLDDDEADAEEEPAERIAEGAPTDFDPHAGWRDRGPLDLGSENSRAPML